NCASFRISHFSHRKTGPIRVTARRILAGATFAVVTAAVSLTSAAPPNGGQGESGEWEIEDRPPGTTTTGGPGRPLVAPSAAAPGPLEQPGFGPPVSEAPGILTPRMTYAQAMASIPFNREEYEANPSYRHDAALEMMFGAMRPTMVVKQNIPYFSR